MQDKERTDSSFGFVVRHYKPDSFSPSKAWKKIGLSRHNWMRLHYAAALAIGIIMAASATLFIVNRPTTDKNEISETTEQQTSKTVKKIEFTDASLLEVIKSIEACYGVSIDNVPEEEYRLTLSYEGTAEDLIATINEILGTQMSIKK